MFLRKEIWSQQGKLRSKEPQKILFLEGVRKVRQYTMKSLELKGDYVEKYSNFIEEPVFLLGLLRI